MTSSLFSISGNSGLPVQHVANAHRQVFVSIWLVDDFARRQAHGAREHIRLCVASREQYFDIWPHLSRSLRERGPEHTARHHHVGEQKFDLSRTRQDSQRGGSIGGGQRTI